MDKYQQPKKLKKLNSSPNHLWWEIMPDFLLRGQKQYKIDIKELNKMICPTCGSGMRLDRCGKVLFCPFCKRALLSN